jgi:ABC-type uncharacterized transport system permease subunit
MYVQRAPLDYLWMSITRTEKFVVAGTIVSLMLVFVVFVVGEPSRIRKQVWKMLFFVIITCYRSGGTRCIVCFGELEL